jgi:hypothetical protein
MYEGVADNSEEIFASTDHVLKILGAGRGSSNVSQHFVVPLGTQEGRPYSNGTEYSHGDFEMTRLSTCPASFRGDCSIMDVNGCGSACVCVYPADVTHVGDILPFWRDRRFGDRHRVTRRKSSLFRRTTH